MKMKMTRKWRKRRIQTEVRANEQKESQDEKVEEKVGEEEKKAKRWDFI